VTALQACSQIAGWSPWYRSWLDCATPTTVSKGKQYYTDGRDDDEEVPPSRSQVRRERKQAKAELEALAKELAALSPKALPRMGLDAELEGAVRILGGMQRTTGMARQRGFVIQLLRRLDTQPIVARLHEFQGTGATDAQQHQRERWRSRLLDEGDAALHEFLSAYPVADRQRLRQAVRAAIAEQSSGASGKRFKELYQLVKEAMLNQPD